MNLSWPVGLVSLVRLNATKTMGPEGLEYIVGQRCAIFVCLLHCESPACACVYHGTATTLGNYSANKLGAGPNRESCFLGLIDSLDGMCSEPDQSPVLTSARVMRLSQASFRRPRKLVSDSREQGCCWKSEEGQNRDSEALRTNRGPEQQSPCRSSVLCCLRAAAVSFSPVTTSQSTHKATNCFRAPSEIPGYFMFKGHRRLDTW